MGAPKGENSDSQHEDQPEHSAVDVHHGEYEAARDPDSRDHDADADLALILFRSLTIVTAIAAIMCMVVNLVSLLRSFRWHLDVSLFTFFSFSFFSPSLIPTLLHPETP